MIREVRPFRLDYSIRKEAENVQFRLANKLIANKRDRREQNGIPITL